MAAINIKPLRKPEQLILTNEEYVAQAEVRKAACDILTEKALGGRFDNLSEAASLVDAFSTENLFRNSRNIGDYVCNRLSTRIVSDEAGRIADILLTVPSFFDDEQPEITVDPSDERHLQKLIGLMYAADGDRHFTMLCHPAQIRAVERWFAGLHIPTSAYSISISTFNYSIWAQDAYVALSDQSGVPILCEGVHFPRYDDPTIADDVSAQTNKSALQSYLYFQGGNILEVGEYVLIGKDYIEDNLGRAHLETEEKILKAFESLLGRAAISVGRADLIPDEHRQYLGGGYYQPIFHIDMYITPTGKKTQDGKDMVMVASPRLGRMAVGEQSRSTDQDVYFDETATQLSNYFHVVRMPILPAYVKFQTASGSVSARYYYLSFNNSIVENYGGNSNIYLPTFSEDVSTYLNDPDILEYEGDIQKRLSLDLAAKTVWEKAGFVVHQMDGLEDLAIGWGSVHCITKTLVRGSV